MADWQSFVYEERRRKMRLLKHLLLKSLQPARGEESNIQPAIIAVAPRVLFEALAMIYAEM